MKQKIIAGAVLFASFTAAASAKDIAVGGRISTLGLGLEAATEVAPKFNLRAVINGLSVDENFEDDDDNEYKADLKLFTIGALADYHPWAGTFRLTAGALYNGFEVKARTKNDQNFTYETDEFTYNGTGRARAKFDFPDFAPYLGVGWGQPIKTGGPWWVSFDAGVMFQGSLKADLALSGSGTVTDNDTGATRPSGDFGNDPAVQQDVQDYEDELEDEAKDFKFWPVVGLGVGYRF